MTLTKQKTILEYFLSSNDLYARCCGIIRSDFFDPELKMAVKYLEDYYTKYKTMPKPDRFLAEFDLDLKIKEVTEDDFVWISDECEKFAKQSLVKDAIKTGLKDIQEHNYDSLVQKILDAVKVTLDRDVGIDFFEKPLDTLRSCIENVEYIPTGISAIDEKLNGLVRKQMTLISANSGVGKSIMMSNIGYNIAALGYNVLYISLELSQEMVVTRLATISTGENTKTWKENIYRIASKIDDIKDAGAGSYVIKRLPNGSNSNDIRAYLKQYEMIYNRKPDIIIVDYLDIMTPIGGISNMSISEQDKAKSEQLYEIGVEYNAHLITASQQNRDGIKSNSPDQTVIAGGFSKINIVDNYFSLYMTPAMRLEGLMLVYFLKTRSSSAVGTNVPLKFNKDNLQITDSDDENKLRDTVNRLSRLNNAIKAGNKKDKLNDQEAPKMNIDIPGLPNVPQEISEDEEEGIDDLIGLMTHINGKTK